MNDASNVNGGAAVAGAAPCSAIPREQDIASCYAQTAASYAQKGMWIEAYNELHHAAIICWDNARKVILATEAKAKEQAAQ